LPSDLRKPPDSGLSLSLKIHTLIRATSIQEAEVFLNLLGRALETPACNRSANSLNGAAIAREITISHCTLAAQHCIAMLVKVAAPLLSALFSRRNDVATTNCRQLRCILPAMKLLSR